MADVTILIGGQSYTVACRDGGEDHLRDIARLVDARVADARSAVGDHLSDTRSLLLAALLLADEIAEIQDGGPPRGDALPEPELARLEALADRLKAASERLVPPDEQV